MKRIFIILFTLLLMVNLSLVTTVPVMAATTYTVDDDWQIGDWPYAEDTDEDDDFATIQAAIDESTFGDIIVVNKGEYHESVKIETANLTLEGVGKVILDGIDVDPIEIGGNTGEV